MTDSMKENEYLIEKNGYLIFLFSILKKSSPLAWELDACVSLYKRNPPLKVVYSFLVLKLGATCAKNVPDLFIFFVIAPSD